MAAAEPDADPKAAIPVDLRRERRLVCVEYPGVVRNEAKMLQTLGGEESVSRVRSWETPGPREGIVSTEWAGPPGGRAVSVATESLGKL